MCKHSNGWQKRGERRIQSQRVAWFALPTGAKLNYEMAKVGIKVEHREMRAIMAGHRPRSGTGRSAYEFNYYKDDMVAGRLQTVNIQR